MARTEQTLMETETVIRFDETNEPAVLWTASARVRKGWESYGYKPVSCIAGWRLEVPKDRIILKAAQKR